MKINEIARDCFEAEQNAPDGLYNDWELEFLMSIKYRTELSEKQEEVLQKLYKKACDSDY